MLNTTFAKLFTPPIFWYANVAFTIFAPYIILWFLQICGVFARSKFVKIQLFVQFSIERRGFLAVVVYALRTFWWELRCPRIRDFKIQRRGRQRERPKHNRFN